jgi:hypothetical protein
MSKPMLRKVRADEKAVGPPAPKRLRAVQVMTFQHPEGGGDGLMMVDNYGDIYLRSDQGWVAFPMMEAQHDDQTV